MKWYLVIYNYKDRVKRIWYLSPMRAAKVQASLRIRAVSPEPPLLAHTSSESRGTFRQKARSLAPLNGWACAVEICHDGMLEDTNSLVGAHNVFPTYFEWPPWVPRSTPENIRFEPYKLFLWIIFSWLRERQNPQENRQILDWPQSKLFENKIRCHFLFQMLYSATVYKGIMTSANNMPHQ